MVKTRDEGRINEPAASVRRNARARFSGVAVAVDKRLEAFGRAV